MVVKTVGSDHVGEVKYILWFKTYWFSIVSLGVDPVQVRLTPVLSRKSLPVSFSVTFADSHVECCLIILAGSSLLLPKALSLQEMHKLADFPKLPLSLGPSVFESLQSFLISIPRSVPSTDMRWATVHHSRLAIFILPSLTAPPHPRNTLSVLTHAFCCPNPWYLRTQNATILPIGIYDALEESLTT